MSDDHLTLLGSQSSFFTNPDDARLESFPNRGTRPYTITLEGRFSPRGGIQLTATAEHNPENRPL